jgi:DNA repair protein RadD
MLTLRPYQHEAKHAVYDHLRTRDDNPCVVIPTAGGKTPVMASVCQDAVTLWNGRVIILAHVKELLEQTADKLNTICPEVRYGVYSAGLKRRDTDRPVIIAGIQSVWKKACEFDPFDLVIVDETHLIPPEGDGMYRQFLDDARTVNPNLRVIGCTATPYRLKSGSICTPEGILNHVYYEVGVRELIVQGYLCPLVTKASKVKADTSRLHVRAGEFVPGEVEALMDDAELVRAACGEIVEQTAARNACLIFASGVKHGEHIVRVMREEHGLECGFITGDMASADRDETLSWFQSGRLKYLINVNVLTTGFDAPHIDCVVLLRPTMSPGLYYHMVGRGFRLHPSKTNCLVLDYGGNVLRHGPVDQIRVQERTLGLGEAPAKECPECHALIAAGYAVCPECGHEFLPPEKQTHDAKASTAAVLSGQVTVETFSVRDVMFGVHTKRGAGEDAPKSLRVDYKVGWHRWKSEWVCLEHDGFARQKAVAWWKKRSKEPVPATAAEAVEIANAGGLASTKSITVRSVSGEEYDRITDHELGPIPELLDRGEARDAGDTEPLGDDALDFPFGYNVATTEEEIPF